MPRKTPQASVLDVEASAGGHEIPSKMYQKTLAVADRVSRVRIQCKGSEGGSFRFKGGSRGVTPAGSLPAEELCQIALGMMHAHAEENPDDGAKYRAVYDYTMPDGKIVPKYAAIDAVWGEEGLSFDDDDDDKYETERERVLAEALENQTEIARQSGSLVLETWERFSAVVERMGKATADLIANQAAVGEAMAASQKGVADAMLQAGQLYREGQSRTVEERRIAVEESLLMREMDQVDRKWEMLGALAPAAIMAGLVKAGVPPEQAGMVTQLVGTMLSAKDEQEMMGAMQGGAAQITGGAPPGMPPGAGAAPMMGAAPGMPAGMAPAAPAHAPMPQAPQAPAHAHPVPAQWEYPGPVDLDAIDGEGAAFALGCWFAERDEREEREARKIVGPTIYDGLRAACGQGDAAARSALVGFGSRVEGLDWGRKLTLFGTLKKALGDEGVSAFQALVSGAQSGRL